eukprot:4140963-Amphidinium_carterae.1
MTAIHQPASTLHSWRQSRSRAAGLPEQSRSNMHFNLWSAFPFFEPNVLSQKSRTQLKSCALVWWSLAQCSTSSICRHGSTGEKC